jgi:hypothetical protein
VSVTVAFEAGRSEQATAATTTIVIRSPFVALLLRINSAKDLFFSRSRSFAEFTLSEKADPSRCSG